MFFRSIFRIFLEFQALYAKQLFELATVGLTACCNRWFGYSHYLCCQCLLKALRVQNICLVLYTLDFVLLCLSFTSTNSAPLQVFLILLNRSQLTSSYLLKLLADFQIDTCPVVRTIN